MTLQHNCRVVVDNKCFVKCCEQLFGIRSMDRMHKILVATFWGFESGDKHMCETFIHILYTHVFAPAHTM